MKLLLDACLSPLTRDALQEAGYDVAWAGDLGRSVADEDVLQLAYAEQRVLITQDNDFGRLAILNLQPHCGIVRLVDYTSHDQASAIVSVLAAYGGELAQGGIVVAQAAGIRRLRQ